MDVNEARQVLWLKSNPRPLGELLDEGSLTESSLRWAAERAYNPRLREAAKVLLAQKNRYNTKQKNFLAEPFNLGITLEEAQKTPWPFSNYRGMPMGDLVESKRLSARDLGYAIDTAYDPKVRKAAIALLLTRLRQTLTEPEKTGRVNLISSGKSYSRKQQLKLSYFQGAVMGALFAWFTRWAIDERVNSAHRRSTDAATVLREILSTPTGIIALVIVLLSFVVVGWLSYFIPKKIEEKFDEKIENYRRGEEGEERVLHTILQTMDGNWTLFRNVNLPGRKKTDLDLVLVGPPGVWVFEVKNYRGEYRNIGARWEHRQGKKWKLLKSSPSQQALNGAVRLSSFLKADGINTFVNPVVVWASKEGQISVENPQVAVWTYERLADELGNIWQKKKLSQTELETIVRKLTKLNNLNEPASQT